MAEQSDMVVNGGNNYEMPTTCAVLTAGLMIAVIAFLIAYYLIRLHYHG